MRRLRRLGPAGIVSYGLLNTCYYTCACLYFLHKSDSLGLKKIVEMAVFAWVRFSRIDSEYITLFFLDWLTTHEVAPSMACS